MSHELTISREHLSANRRMIIGRALAASMAGVFPVPIVEEWMSTTISRGTVKRIAESHAVDVDTDAARMIADGPQSPAEWTELVGSTLLYKVVSRTWRKLLITYVVAKRTQAAAQHFSIGTLFDHYCARLHVGMGLDKQTGLALREVIMRAIDETPGGIGNNIFSRSVSAAAKATVSAPLNLLDMASGGLVRRLLSGNSDEVEAIAEVDQHIDAEMRERKGFLARTTTAVELQLSSEGNPYVQDLVTKFETLWRSHIADSAADD